MPNSFLPTQSAYRPTGANGVPQVSTYIVGRTISGSYEGVGLGAGGRPDYVETVVINLTDRASDGTLTQKGTITINVDDLIAIKNANANMPANLNMSLQEVAFCSAGTNKRGVMLVSQLYNP